jgi:hypothetical protein
VIGHALNFVICLLVGHDPEPLWKVGPRGVQWQCPRCLRVRDSRALRAVRR